MDCSIAVSRWSLRLKLVPYGEELNMKAGVQRGCFMLVLSVVSGSDFGRLGTEGSCWTGPR